MRTIDTWLIQAISNLHAGKGDADFGIVDKHVQRDPVTELPTIFASSIKGALRELFETNTELKTKVNDIFGSDAGGKAHSQGEYRFYDARLLALPVRSSHQFYYLATCPEVICDFLDDLKRFKCENYNEVRKTLRPLAGLKIEEGSPKYIGGDHGDITLEEFTAQKIDLPEPAVSGFQSIILASRFAIFNGRDFKELCEELPTVARNYLDNGVSKNLWYEEIVPRETRFYFFTSRPGKDDPLTQGIKGESISKLVQIGANATVGFGLCKLEKLTLV